MSTFKSLCLIFYDILRWRLDRKPILYWSQEVGSVPLWAQLRTGQGDAARGAVDALKKIVAAVRKRCPKARIIVRADIFNGDSTITSAVLDRLLHHAETVLIEGSSYRMKDRIEP
jgi:hypothetical protein